MNRSQAVKAAKVRQFNFEVKQKITREESTSVCIVGAKQVHAKRIRAAIKFWLVQNKEHLASFPHMLEEIDVHLAYDYQQLVEMAHGINETIEVQEDNTNCG